MWFILNTVIDGVISGNQGQMIAILKCAYNSPFLGPRLLQCETNI